MEFWKLQKKNLNKAYLSQNVFYLTYTQHTKHQTVDTQQPVSTLTLSVKNNRT